MKLFKRLQEFAAFTKNEQKVFLFLSLVFLAGVSVKAYKAYFVGKSDQQFDYSASDREFEEKSKRLGSLPAGGLSHDAGVVSHAPETGRRINLNIATKKDLVSLPGIGEAIAEEILLYRDERGRFHSVDELRQIKGIGARKLEKLRPYVEIK